MTKSTNGAGKSANGGKKRPGGLPDEEAADEDDDEDDAGVRPAASIMLISYLMACKHSSCLLGVVYLVIATERKYLMT